MESCALAQLPQERKEGTKSSDYKGFNGYTVIGHLLPFTSDSGGDPSACICAVYRLLRWLPAPCLLVPVLL